MIKALFLDMDETLCDTLGANEQAKQRLASNLQQTLGEHFDGPLFAEQYVKGMYREWTDEQRQRYTPIIEQQSEGAFRRQLIHDLLAKHGSNNSDDHFAQNILDQFDQHRIEAFDFYPGITDFLLSARKLFKLVVITNGPEYSQIPKIKKLNLSDYVDHILIGGQQPEQKPAPLFF
nr:HAD family hydrolase [Oceanicoccus sp. KOV_DT_Chl]